VKGPEPSVRLAASSSEARSASPSPPTSPSSAGTAPSPASPAASLLERLQSVIGDTVIGYSGAIEALTIALSTDGHVLLEGLPGLAKTYLVREFARALDLTYRRIQFTPDMLPLDIVGNVILNAKTQQFEFRPGPVFSNVLLADEINRAPPKVQSALLEAMQEFQVTVDGRTYPLPRPFLVIATQNPLDQEGTFPLPESQLDRFMFRYVLQYPPRDVEIRILATQAVDPGHNVPGHVVTQEQIGVLRASHQGVFLHPDVLAYIADIVRETRNDTRIQVGASPRAGVHLMLAARALAFLDGRHYVLPDDVRSAVFAVLNHRIVLRPDAKRARTPTSPAPGPEGLLREVIDSVVDRVRAPR